MIVRLRKLTPLSTLGFGYDKDKTVAEMILLYKQLDLLKIYYALGNIDFSDDIKNILCITKDREIQKPGSMRHGILHPTLKINQYEIIGLCLADYNEKHNNKEEIKIKNSFLRVMNKQDKLFRKRQWSDKEYNKQCMAWVNQHYGINR